jgi:hypothetical protein
MWVSTLCWGEEGGTDSLPAPCGIISLQVTRRTEPGEAGVLPTMWKACALLLGRVERQEPQMSGNNKMLLLISLLICVPWEDKHCLEPLQ